jgi:NAD(P)-dependent dehydrogenase (short-subunit alcohol dehydrogenase family)
MANRLTGKVALITGAARGMGEAEARIFAQEGARVIVADVLDTEGRRVTDEINRAQAGCAGLWRPVPRLRRSFVRHGG